MDSDLLSKILKPLIDLGAVAGVSVFDRQRALHDSLPARDAAELRKVLWEITDGYAKVGRQPQQLAFGFNGSGLLVCSGTHHKLAVVLHAPDQLEIAGRAALAVSAEIEREWATLSRETNGRKSARVRLLRWQDCEPSLRAVLSKVLASAQAERLIARELADRKLQKDQPTDVPQLRAFSESLLAHVPLKSRRELLRAEIDHYLETLQS